jgi:N-acetylglutamate synthase-like GNAT family acetyltransferase
MVNIEIVKRKLKKLNSYHNELSFYENITWEKYLKNFQNKRVIERLLQLIVDVAVDINSHAVVDSGSPPPCDSFIFFLKLQNYARVMNECFGDEIEENTLKKLLKDPSVLVYMLEDQGEVIGSITMQLRKKLSLGYIYDVAVMKKHREKGLGSYLLQQCILELKDHGIKTASLMVAGKNKNALGFYEKVGFKAVDRDMIMQKII